MPRKNHVLQGVFVALGILLLDQVTKLLVRSSLSLGELIPLFGDIVRIRYTTNTGAAFSIFTGQTFFLTIVSLGILGFLFFHYHMFPKQPIVQTAIFLIIGGALGNLIDRIFLGRVTDFIDIGIGNLRWPTFNIADSAITIAAVLIVMYWMFYEKREKKGKTA